MDMRTISVAVTEQVHEKLRRLKKHWDLTNVDSVIERLVNTIFEQIEKTGPTAEPRKAGGVNIGQ